MAISGHASKDDLETIADAMNSSDPSDIVKAMHKPVTRYGTL